MLITCKECGKKISDKALFCPNCGAPGQAYSDPIGTPNQPSPTNPQINPAYQNSNINPQINPAYQNPNINPQINPAYQNPNINPQINPAYQNPNINMQINPTYQTYRPQPVMQPPKKNHPIGWFFAASTPFVIITAVQLITVIVFLIFFFSIATSLPIRSFEEALQLVQDQSQKNVAVILITYEIISLLIFAPWYYLTWGSKRNGNSNVKLMDIAMVLVVSIGFQLAVTSFLSILDNMAPGALDTYKELLQNTGLSKGGIGTIISTVILAPIVEELAFRGVTFEFSKKISKYILVGIIIQAFFFGLSHLNWIQGIPTFIVAIFWGYISYTHDCIWISIIGHMALNGCAYLLDPLFYLSYRLGTFGDILYILIGTGLIIWGILHYYKRDFA